MSESIPDTAVEAAQAPVEAPEVVEAPQPVETPTEAPQEPEQPAPQPKKPQGDRRFAIMTAKLKAEEAARLAAERERDAARALLDTRGDALETPSRPQAAPDIETAAARLIAQREFDARRQAVIAEGSKEFPDWAEKTEILHGLGATGNKHFMEALVELPNAARLVAHLADDADALVGLLQKSPTAMAAAMGRMDAQMTKQAARPLSSAPEPAPRVRGTAIPQEPTPHNYPKNLSMKEWNRMMDAHLPPSLGGTRKAR